MTSEDIVKLTTDDAGDNVKNGQDTPKGKPFGNISRTLDTEDLKNPGVQKMLLNENDRLEIEAKENREFRDRFYEVSTNLAILEEKASGTLAVDTFFAICLSIGALLIGTGISREGEDWVIGVSGGVLLVASIIIKTAKGIKQGIKQGIKR